LASKVANQPKAPKVIVGITGATGTIFGVRLLQALQDCQAETHLIISKWGGRTLTHETSLTAGQVRQFATYNYGPHDEGATISSGSFLTRGMVVCPCSMRTLAAIANGHGDQLIHRAADVILKERRKLVLVVRETPLNDIHLENMLKLSRMGTIVFPPVPAFYNHPQSIDDIINHTVMRILDQLDIHLDLRERWDGQLSDSGTVRSLGSSKSDAV
jgi:4-hydroxy-3-polyprenylbenzoate decarboxylase